MRHEIGIKMLSLITCCFEPMTISEVREKLEGDLIFKKRLDNYSKTTFYNNFRQLVEKGLIKNIGQSEEEGYEGEALFVATKEGREKVREFKAEIALLCKVFEMGAL